MVVLGGGLVSYERGPNGGQLSIYHLVKQPINDLVGPTGLVGRGLESAIPPPPAPALLPPTSGYGGYGGWRAWVDDSSLQGYLAHKKTPTQL